VEASLELPGGWQQRGDFGWRYRVAGYAAWLWSGVSLEDDPAGIRVTQRSPNWFKRPNEQARMALEPGDLIVTVDGRSGLSRSQYIAYLMREKEPGSSVEPEVVRDGRKRPVRLRMPSPQPVLLGH
jgi:S1-C subfamily serine protease